MWKSVVSVRAGRRWLGRGLVLAAICVACLGCRGVDPVVKIGLVGPFEGQKRAVGYDVIYSARLAVREINQAGGVGGYRVALVALDDSGDNQLAREAAESLVVDPAVVAVVGHWQASTTATAASIYARAGLPFLAMGEPPFGVVDPQRLPAAFQEAYTAVTPFGDAPGPFAGTTYDAFHLLRQALVRAAATAGRLDRPAVAGALTGLEYEGMSGTVYYPD